MPGIRKYKFIAVLSAMLFGSTLNAAAIEVTIEVPQGGEGAIFAALFSEPDGFPKESKADRTIEKEVPGNAVEVVFDNLSAGSYSIAVFQDLDGDKALSTNFVGIPEEPYGFSNGAGTLGTPDFGDAAFPLDAQQTKSVVIKAE